MVRHFEYTLMTEDMYCYNFIGDIVKEFTEESGIKNGIVTVISAHTNCGILVTEALPCIMSDLDILLHELVKDDAQYSHAHFLPTYGRTSANAYGHLRSILIGNNCVFPIVDGKIALGDAQEIVHMEFDGPQTRKIFIDVLGE